MDFGKKGDAKKAMKLKWKEGISLKEAWKRVQKKDKKMSSKDSKMSPKRKKVQANAKKVMKLKWKEGISLKEAWKRVSFGDAVCPPGKVPNKKWTGKCGQQICVKECGFYQTRNPDTNRCKNMVMQPKMSGTPKMVEIPVDYELGPKGRIRKMCMPGQYRDPVSGRCRKIKPMLQPLMIPTLFGSVDSLKKGPRGHTFGKKCGFGSCSACAIN
tara:strand:+ start:5099 stop:5737 length:639 start_codon:yes stop_codon:yes gene_type:complete